MTNEEKLITICDDRFEIISKAKKHIIEATNIEMSPKEMEVLDNFLFRCWQMGWLKNDFRKLEKENEQLKCDLYNTNANLQHITIEYEEKNAELKEELKICQSVASEIVNKMKNCGNCKYLTRKLLNRRNNRICKINPNNIYDVCDIWELAE